MLKALLRLLAPSASSAALLTAISNTLGVSLALLGALGSSGSLGSLTVMCGIQSCHFFILKKENKNFFILFFFNFIYTEIGKESVVITFEVHFTNDMNKTVTELI